MMATICPELMWGNSTEAVSMTDRQTSTTTTTAVNMLVLRPLTQGPKHVPVIAQQQQQEHARGREQCTRQDLHALGQQAKRGSRDEYDRGRHPDQGRVDRVEPLGAKDAPVQRVVDAEHVADRAGGGQRDRERADDRGVEQRDREDHARRLARVGLQPGRQGRRRR